MKRFVFSLLLASVLLLAACSTADPWDQTPSVPATVVSSTPTPTDDPALIPTLFPNSNNDSDLTRTDEQGMVVVEVTPINLGMPADTLEFDIALNTHSVDLSMDLTTLATLTTDTGMTIQPALWDAPRGGHHVEGKLIFPAAVDGKPVLEGVIKLTLTIANLDVPSRVFEWQLK